MDQGKSTPATPLSPALQVYLLGRVDFDAALTLQARLHYEVSGDRSQGALILCEHEPLITLGRQGSTSHVLCEPPELRAREWRVRWVNRGGPCLLHLPGQLAIYPILPLDRLGLGVQAYLDHFQQILVDMLADFGIRAEGRRELPGIWVGSRLIAGMGLAVRDWVSYYGAYLNINPPLDPFRLVQSAGPGSPMTSLERERRGPLRPALVRERFLEHFTAQFAFNRVALFTDHPSLSRKASPNALASRA